MVRCGGGGGAGAYGGGGGESCGVVEGEVVGGGVGEEGFPEEDAELEFGSDGGGAVGGEFVLGVGVWVAEGDGWEGGEYGFTAKRWCGGEESTWEAER